MTENSNEAGHGGRALTFLLIGAGIGALVALMYAPKVGEQFRRDLRRKYKNAREAMEEFADEARDRVEEAIDRGTDWMESMERDARKRVTPLKRALQRD
jgi:gas vesicle protein